MSSNSNYRNDSSNNCNCNCEYNYNSVNKNYYVNVCRQKFNNHIKKNSDFNNNNNDFYNTNININTKWQTVPYAGMNTLPIPETPEAWCWPLCFLKRKWNDQFMNFLGEPVNTNINNPHKSMDLEKEFDYLCHLQKVLTQQDIALCKYWGDGPPSKQFMPIADILIDTYGVSACHAGRILYVLNGALNDTFCITWYYKFLWNIVRPCQYNREFHTVLCTPFHPTYPAGHSTTAGCMAEILSYYFPKEREKLFILAQSCSNSRYLSGVHFRIDCDEGLKLGVNIAKCILKYTSQQTDMSNKKIDIVYNEYKNANIFPMDLQQYIPFNRQSKCPSLLLDTQHLPCK